MKTALYTYHFRRYLGRNLTRAEAAVIGPLEKMRIRRLQRRILIVDPPGVDSRGILCAYIEYLRKVHSPGADLLVMTQRKAVSDHIAWRLRVPGAQTYSATGRRPENVRGLNYSMALLLDIQDYGRCSPARSDGEFHRVTKTVFPVIGGAHDSLLILHARSDVPWLHRWPALRDYTDPSLGPPDVPIKIPDPTVPITLRLLLAKLWCGPAIGRTGIKGADCELCILNCELAERPR